MQLGHAEPVGVQHDHHRGVGNVHPDLDHGGGHQHVEVTRGERTHHGVLLVRGKPAVQHPDPQPVQRSLGEQRRHLGHRERRPTPGVVLLRRLLIGTGPVADPWAHHVRLVTGGHLLPQPTPGAVQEGRLLGRRNHVRRDRRTPPRQLRQGGDLQVPVDGHGHRTRDGRRRHDQHVRRLFGLRAQRVPLLDTEPVLLVNHHQAEVGEVDTLVQQGVRAEDDAGGTAAHLAQRPAAGRRAQRPGDQLHPGGVLDGVQLTRAPQRAEQVEDAAVMLGGEHLGRGQQGGLPAGVDHLEHRAQRHHRLTGTDLALKQPMHRVGGGQVRRDLDADVPLTDGQLVWQAGVERVPQATGHRGSWPGRTVGGLLLTLHQGELHGERLVPLEPTAGPVERLLAGRPVDLP